MNVKLGWSGEIHGTWTKMDIEVDESDYAQLLNEHEVDSSSLSQIEKFKVMYLHAEVFVQLHKMSRFPDVFGKEADKVELTDLITTRDKILKAKVANV